MRKDCSIDKCLRPSYAAGLCVKHYNEDYERRKALRDREREERTSKKGPSHPPLPKAAEKAEATPTGPTLTVTAPVGVKFCKRCKKEKADDKTFRVKRQLCGSCAVFIRKCEREGRPVPEYTGRGRRTKTGEAEKLTFNINNPLGTYDAEAMQGVIDEVVDKTLEKARSEKSKDKIKKTEVVEHNGGRFFSLKTTVDPTYYLSVDFTDYPELKAALDELARTDFRTPEMQVLAILSEILPDDNKD